jgi:hypothetical protein
MNRWSQLTLTRRAGATPKGHKTFIICTAPHPEGPTYIDLTFLVHGALKLLV